MALQASLAVQPPDQQSEETDAWRTATRLRTQRQEQTGHAPTQAPPQQDVVTSPPSKSQTLSNHIRQAALLSSQCHDVSVAAFDRVYRLHRIFLVQSSFFSSMLRGGFSEGLNYRPPGMNYSSSSSSSDSGSTLRLTFDDPNITRPAFEYCIAHLYAAAPELILPQWAIASTAQPLSSYWPPTSGPRSRPLPIAAASATGDYQPATPRFLVSLLCTSLWLGVPSLTASAFTLILASFTPYTVSTYLRFALGRPLIGAQEARERGESSEAIWDWELEGPCWGMESIGTLEQGRGASYETSSTAAPMQRTDTSRTAVSSYHSDYEDAPSDEGDQDHKPTRSSSIRLSETRRGARNRSRSSLRQDLQDGEDDQRSASGSRVFNHKHQPSANAAPNVAGSIPGSYDPSSYDTFGRAAPPPEISLDYGPYGRRVAESCFCYFARWGREIAAAEEVKWGRDEAALHALLDSMERGQDAAHGQALVCEAVAPYLLPRGCLPARLPDEPSAAGAWRPGDKKVQIEAAVQWDLPCPALNVFSHPALSHTLFEIRSLGLPFTPGLTEELMYFVDPMSGSSLGLASSHLVDFLSSDAFFVRNELQRYDVAKNIVTFRRDQKALVEELQDALGLLDEGFGYAYTDDSQLGAPTDTSAFVKAEPTDSQDFGSSPSRHDDSVAGRVRARSRAGSSASARPWTTPPRLLSSAVLPTGAPTPSSRNLPSSRLNTQHHADDASMDLDDSFQGSRAPKSWLAPNREGDEFQMLEEDDVHYARLFEQGIYYSHLDFDDLKRLSEEAAMLADAGRETEDGYSDSDGESRRAGERGSVLSSRRQAATQMFAPVEVLQAALWAGHDLRARVMGAGQSSQEEGGVESIRRGLAFMGDSNAEGLPASTSGVLETGAGVRSQEGLITAPERDESLLGISSSLKQFAQAFQQTIAGHSRRGPAPRFGRGARGETPSTPLGSPLRAAASRSTPEGTSLTLGGLSYSPLTPGGVRAGGAHPAAKNLLNKRYFSVPVDDTVRYGEYFTGLLGASSSNGQASGASASIATDPSYASDATGLAAMRDPLSLPATVPPHARTAVKKILPVIADSLLLSNVDRYLTGGPLSDMKRITGNLFGLKNKASTGKALGKVGVEVSRKKAVLDGELQGDVPASPSSFFSPGKSRTAQSVGSRSNPIDLSNSGGTPEGSAQEPPANTARDEEERGSGFGQRNNITPAAHSEDDRDFDSGLQLARLETRSWTGFEPMRIGVEYYGLDLLEEKHRLYSPSFFYAGSVWNLYVQTIRKPKGTQLGVYLHRQSPMEPLPPATASPESVANFYHGTHGGGGAITTTPGAPREAGATLIDEQLQQGVASGSNGGARGRLPGQQGQGQGQGQGPGQVPHLPARLDSLPINSNLSLPLNAAANAGANHNVNANRDAGGTPPPPRYGAAFTQPELPFTAVSPSVPSNGPPVLPGISPAVPYRDPRRLVRAFFSIHCHAPLGSALTRFDSGPDRFLESQSWGWKSSSLMGVWELQKGALSGGRAETADGFRCVVTMGV
ncbi:hypothetical protein BCV69DRAFT_281894, partial [Microstroma glucosiphilum]